MTAKNLWKFGCLVMAGLLGVVSPGAQAQHGSPASAGRGDTDVESVCSGEVEKLFTEGCQAYTQLAARPMSSLPQGQMREIAKDAFEAVRDGKAYWCQATNKRSFVAGCTDPEVARGELEGHFMAQKALRKKLGRSKGAVLDSISDRMELVFRYRVLELNRNEWSTASDEAAKRPFAKVYRDNAGRFDQLARKLRFQAESLQFNPDENP